MCILGYRQAFVNIIGARASINCFYFVVVSGSGGQSACFGDDGDALTLARSSEI